MARWHPPTLDELLYESEHKRSIHPTLSDGEVLDDLKHYLESNSESPLYIRQLTFLNRQNGPFRLTDGRLCHYPQTTKVMSTSITSMLAQAMPWLWISANKFWGMQSCQATSTIKGFPYHSVSNPPGDAREIYRGRVYLNLPNPITKPGRFRFITPLPFRNYRYASIRFCVLRDPVERFFSSWMDLRRRYPKKFGHLTDPEEFLHITSHPDTREEYRDIHHQPQTWFLGKDPRYYTHIFSMRDLSRLEEFLSDICGKPIMMLHKHNSVSRDKNHDIPASLRQRIEAHYAQDYKIWGKYF